ncbi:unnamed protein product [Amoebophrya sp. A120]|nr:unnamed protein product [Amoebophrya sp. A120]|eukprot:GSA120T00023657001.1
MTKIGGKKEIVNDEGIPNMYIKQLTPDIIRRLTMERIQEDDMTKCNTVSEYMMQRRLQLGPFRPPTGVLQNRESETLMFYLWLGVAPSGQIGWGEIRYGEDKVFKQECAFCKRYFDCAVDHVLLECPSLDTQRRRTLSPNNLTRTLGRDYLQNPQKILTFITEEDANLTTKFHRDRIQPVLGKTGTTMEKKQKTKLRASNVFEKYAESSNMVQETFKRKVEKRQ